MIGAESTNRMPDRGGYSPRVSGLMVNEVKSGPSELLMKLACLFEKINDPPFVPQKMIDHITNICLFQVNAQGKTSNTKEDLLVSRMPKCFQVNLAEE